MNKINNLRYKLDTPISNQLSDEGVDLSAGEKQRLNLSRNYLKKNLFFILDEPTSNLDAKMEGNILNSILKNRNFTLVLISHNLKFAEQVDKIIFLQGGKVLEVGTLKQLLSNKDGAFLQLYEAYNNKI